jgi:putative oxidoreductase
MDLAAPSRPAAARPAHDAPGRIRTVAQRVLRAVDLASPLLDLGLRVYVANVFLQSGLTKIASWQQTLALFDSEYAVPLLPPAVAAYLGTAAELGLPLLLLFGLGTRAAAATLFVFNIVAVLSYPDLSPAGLQQHQFWGALMLVTIFHGPGRLSLDHLIRRRVLA